jgi:hypothetical protein
LASPLAGKISVMGNQKPVIARRVPVLNENIACRQKVIAAKKPFSQFTSI